MGNGLRLFYFYFYFYKYVLLFLFGYLILLFVISFVLGSALVCGANTLALGLHVFMINSFIHIAIATRA